MKISFSLRAFIVYFLVISILAWFILDKATERLNVALRQSAESVMVDAANLVATSLEERFTGQELDTSRIESLLTQAYEREINAQIYRVLKPRIDTEIYVTDRAGIVVYDSAGERLGDDYSEWRDVRLTMQGEYGARTSYRYEDQTEEDDDKIMVVAAPINAGNEIVGVVSVVKPIRSLEAFFADESAQLKQYAIGIVALAMICAYLVSQGFTTSITRLAGYAKDMASGRKVAEPRFMDVRFSNLAEAITHLRQQVDGKQYVESYVHSLTHELKTPITAIKASLELIDGEIPEEERARFLRNIGRSNERMAVLVDRMLDLAELESTDHADHFSRFDLVDSIRQLLAERDAVIRDRGLSVTVEPAEGCNVRGDPLLLQQAVANLLDNAIIHGPARGEVVIRCQRENGNYRVEVFNSGEVLDHFVLERAFDRFFSLPARGETSKSTGLGLSFVKEIMSLHQGTATLANAENGILARLQWPRPA